MADNIESSDSPNLKLHVPREAVGWQLHAMLSFDLGIGVCVNSLRYIILNFVTSQEVQKFVLFPRDGKTSFKTLLEVDELVQHFRVKTMCHLATEDLEMQDIEFHRDFPYTKLDIDSEPAFLSTFRRVLRVLNAKLRNDRICKTLYIKLKDAVSPCGLDLVMCDDLIKMLQMSSKDEGFVYVQNNISRCSSKLKNKLTGCNCHFLMIKSSGAPRSVFNMSKLFIKQSENPSGDTQGDHEFFPSPPVTPMKNKVIREIVYFDSLPKQGAADQAVGCPAAIEGGDCVEVSEKIVHNAENYNWGDVFSVMGTLVIFVFILSAIYGLIVSDGTPHSASGGPFFLFFELVAVAVLLPMLLCYRFLIADDSK